MEEGRAAALSIWETKLPIHHQLPGTPAAWHQFTCYRLIPVILDQVVSRESRRNNRNILETGVWAGAVLPNIKTQAADRRILDRNRQRDIRMHPANEGTQARFTEHTHSLDSDNQTG